MATFVFLKYLKRPDVRGFLNIFFTVSETVCMLGVVPVRTQGSVVANEPLYASSNTPGVAVSASMLSNQECKEASVIGYSFQSRQCLQKDDVSLYFTYISIYLIC